MIEYKPWSKEVLVSLTQEAYKGVFSCLDIELGGECPYNCVYCETPYRDALAKIDINKVCKFLETGQFKWVYICGIGEPTYSTNGEQLLRILEKCEENNVKCSIFTNLSNLSDRFIEYIKKGILFCLFKFDSRLPDVIERLYRPMNLEQHINNIEKLLKFVHCDGRTTNMAASIVPTKENLDEIIYLVQWCIEHNIYPLVAQLEYAGSAKDVFDDLVLEDKTLCKLKTDINNFIGEEYNVPLCPAVLSGLCITYNNEIVIDHRTGLSCHSFWLEDPQRDIVCNNISELWSLNEITRKVISARAECYKVFCKKSEEYQYDVLGGCGGNKKDIFRFYREMMEKSYHSHPSNNNNLKINRFVYLDNNATTRISHSVLSEMQHYLDLGYANPNSNSQLGRNNRFVINKARMQIAKALNCSTDEVYFTSCGSESNSWAINSCLNNELRKDKKIILSTSIEHESVLDHLEILKAKGYKIVNIPISKDGDIDLDSFLSTELPLDDVCFATVMIVNNETGVINDIRRLAGYLHQYQIPLHCDAVQAFGKMQMNMSDLGVDYLSISGHKIHAPKGIGALYVRKGQYLEPLIYGQQESRKRGGTENVAYIVALGKATEEAYSANLKENIERIEDYRNRIESYLEKNIENVIINGKYSKRVANTSNIGFIGIDAVKLSLLLESRGIYVSNGAACNTVNPKQSHVLKAMQSPAYESGALRISLSNYTEEKDIEYFLDNLMESIKNIKGVE